MASVKQWDAVKLAFEAYSSADFKFHQLHDAANSRFNLNNADWSKAEEIAREGKQGWQQEVDKLDLKPNQRAAVDAYAVSVRAHAALSKALTDAGETPKFIKYVIDETKALNRRKDVDVSAKASEIGVKSGGVETNYEKVIASSRSDAVKEERAEAKRQADAKAAKEAEDAAKAAAEAKAAGIDSLKATTELVGKGRIINIDGTSPKDEPARVEVANALNRYVLGLDADEQKAFKKKIGLKDDADFKLTDDAGEKITDRKLLGKALRLYQADRDIGADGKVGPATLGDLLTYNGVWVGNSRYLPQVVNGVTKIVGDIDKDNFKFETLGHLCGKMRPCDLQNYQINRSDPLNSQKLAAKETLNDISVTLTAAKIKFESQEVTDTYTAKEKEAMKALFEKLDPEKITNEGIVALEKAFGLKVDKGVIGTEVARALAQIEIRLATDKVLDPSEIKAAVVANARPAAKVEGR